MSEENLGHQQLCLCCSQEPFASCCEPLLTGQIRAHDPQQLMRSRYTAFCLGNYDYLRQTWHPDTCPEDLGTDEPTNWIKLEILDSWMEDDEGEVEFKASLIHDQHLEVLHEISSFDRINQQWFYHSGEFQNENARPQKISKQAECPCGSGKVFKFCHARR